VSVSASGARHASPYSEGRARVAMQLPRSAKDLLARRAALTDVSLSSGLVLDGLWSASDVDADKSDQRGDDRDG